MDFLKLLSRDFEQTFGHNVSLRVKTLNNINLVASMHIKRENGQLLVDFRPSKTSLHKVQYQARLARLIFLQSLKYTYFYTVNKSELKMAVQTGQTCMPGKADIFQIIRCRLEILCERKVISVQSLRTNKGPFSLC